jgi:hypothetical protein
MEKIVTFGQPRLLPAFRDGIEYIFPYKVTNIPVTIPRDHRDDFFDYSVKVGASRSLTVVWQVEELLLPRVLFEYGKQYIVQKLKDGTLSNTEELFLTTYSVESNVRPQFDTIPEPNGATVTVEIPEAKLMEEPKFQQLADSIISARDVINALFHGKHGAKLILLTEERVLLQFFRDAKTEEEFVYRVCALASAATYLNDEKLREITGITGTQQKSISLLAAYFQQARLDGALVIGTLRSINRLRQGFPVHGDRADRIVISYEQLGLKYPIDNYSYAWQTLLMKYREALQQLLESLKSV